MKKIFLFIPLLLSLLTISRNLYCQEKISEKTSKDKPNYVFSNSIGKNFKKSNPTYYLSILKKFKANFFLGLRAGLDNHKIDPGSYLYSLFVTNEIINNAGYYHIRGQNLSVEGTPYILALQTEFQITGKWSVNLSAGIKDTPLKKYEEVEATIVNTGTSLTYSYSLGNYSKENKIKTYYSGGIDYNFGKFRLGVFADNIFSAGINTGVSF